ALCLLRALAPCALPRAMSSPFACAQDPASTTTTAGPDPPQTHQSIRWHLAIALVLLLLLVGGIGGLATTTELSGAVISNGQLVVDSEVKKVQHPTGGIVGQLLVTNGTRVKAGDVVIRLDETQTRSNFAIHRKNLDQLPP